MDLVEDTVNDLERNRRVIRMQAEGLSHEQSLLQPPFRANCLNWVVGHVLVHRDKMLRALDSEPLLDGDTTDRYENESEPVTGDGPEVVGFERLLGWLDESQWRLAERLREVGADRLEEELEVAGRTTTRWKRLHFLYFHETYHVGQTELLRQLGGTNDKVI